MCFLKHLFNSAIPVSMNEEVRRTHAHVARLLARLAIKAVVGTPDVWWGAKEPAGDAVVEHAEESARRRKCAGA